MMEHLRPWLNTMYPYCSSELYDLDRLKKDMTESKAQSALVKEGLEAVLRDRQVSSLDWENYMNVEHANDDDLYDFCGHFTVFFTMMANTRIGIEVQRNGRSAYPSMA